MKKKQIKPISRHEDLTDEQVENIRKTYQLMPISQCDLAEIYGVSQSYISGIINRKMRKEERGYRRKDVIRDYPEYASRVFYFSTTKSSIIEKQIGTKIFYNKSEVDRLVSILKLVDEGSLIDSTTAGSIIGVTRERVRQYKEQGRFTTITIGDREYLYRVEVEQFSQMRTSKRIRKEVIPEKVQEPIMSFPHIQW